MLKNPKQIPTLYSSPNNNVQTQFQISNFTIYSLDRTFPPDFVYDGEMHNFWEVVYVIDGNLEVTEDENIYLLGPRDIIFHAPNEFHRLSSAEGTSPHVLNVSFFANTDLPQALKDGIFNLSHDLHSEYLSLFYMLHGFSTSKKMDDISPISNFELVCRYSAFIMRLLRENKAKNRISSNSTANTYHLLVETMQNEILNNLSIEELSEKSYISVSYIKKLFARYAGISPKSYYSVLRIREAQKLLSSRLSVSEIADLMNFSSPNYFTTFFKKHTHMTPVQYKKSVSL